MPFKKDLMLLTIDTKPILDSINDCLFKGERPVTMADLKRCEGILRTCLEVGIKVRNKDGSITEEIKQELRR